jgi:hypothetical protein
MTSEQKSARGRKGAAATNSGMTPEQKSNSVKKGWVTRRKNTSCFSNNCTVVYL